MNDLVPVAPKVKLKWMKIARAAEFNFSSLRISELDRWDRDSQSGLKRYDFWYLIKFILFCIALTLLF